MIRYLTAALLAMSVQTGPSYAHSGGLNAEGCHAGSRPYHCHRSSGQSSRSAAPQSGLVDRNCSDFSSWSEAQRFYEQSGRSDPHGLDRDRDGIACEALR